MTTVKRVLSQNWFLFVVIALFLLLRLPSLFEPYWYGDEGIYLTLGNAIRKGLTLYTQIHDNKPPSLYYLAAFGQTVFGFRLLLMFFMAPSVYLFYKLSRHLLSPPASRFSTLIFVILSSIPLIEGNIANAEVFMLLPTLLGIYLFYKQQNLKTALAAGLLLGLAFSIKVPVAVEMAFLCFWLICLHFDFKWSYFSKKLKNNVALIVVLAAAFSVPVLLWLVYFAYKHALPQFLYAALLQNFGYLSSWTTGSQKSTATQGGLMTRGLLMAISWLIVFFLNYRKIIDKKLAFILLWFSAALFGSLLSGRPYPHYLIQLLPSFCLLLVWIFQKKISFFSRILPILFILFFAFTIYRFHFYAYKTLPYYANFYSYALNRKSRTDYNAYFGSQVNTTELVSAYIKANTQPSDRIFIWGDEPYIYALSDRLPSGRYTVAYHIVDFNGYTETIDSLKIYLPKFIIMFPMNGRPFPELSKFIYRYYQLVNIIGPAHIYRLI
ncbi:MAG TPA: glycosyltransferase family 39 protein [Patescibacteria group bacterium]